VCSLGHLADRRPLGTALSDKLCHVALSLAPDRSQFYSDEYPRGLSPGRFGCASAVLPITLATPIGIVLDRQGDLVVCDGSTAAVDIIAPPFKSVTGTLGSGWVAPFFVTIDKAGTQAYVTDLGAGNVQVLTYPAGTNVATLGSANGLALPVEMVDSKNFVP
jgi:DNA-binding beta-propeller fold protein YncE